VKRTGRLKTYKPLERHTPLRQVSGLKASAMKQTRPMPAVPVDVREALRKRAGEGEWCEAQLPGVCAGRAIDPHHRIKQQSGGRHGEAKKEADRLSNVVYLCRPCHSWAHWKPFGVTHPMGLILRQHEVPSQEPVLYRGHPMFLDDAGGVHEYEAHCA
jgi:hypothetical protein